MAESSALEDGHGRTHSKLASLVGGGRHYPTLRTTDDHRFAKQLRVVNLFNRGIKGIHVDVQNTREHGFISLSCHEQFFIDSGQPSQMSSEALDNENDEGGACELLVHEPSTTAFFGVLPRSGEIPAYGWLHVVNPA